jgi:hypothetical protein
LVARGERALAHHPLGWVVVAVAATAAAAVAGVGVVYGVAAGRRRLRAMQRRPAFG